MAANKLRLQSFRTNDLVNDGGKQFELGKSWCDDFFEFDKTLPEVVVNLKFKAIQAGHVSLNDKIIELKLADVSTRGDRKAYVNGNNGMSQIKDFFINDLHLTPDNNLTDYFAIYKVSEFDYFLYFVPSILYKNFLQFFRSVLPTVSVNHDKEYLETDVKNSLQQIFYGAPGTGKSHIIKEQTKGEDVIRTTFHPDTDYSTFVGTYKPTTEFAPVLAIIGDKAVDTGREEKRISYEFVCQPFLQAYVAAWKKVAEAKGSTAKKQFLVIEEINRGNCAQIFGDLFQLLDRNDFGYSDYPIKADADMQKQLKRLFEGVTITDADSINAMYDGRDIVKEVLSGEVLLLPNNLYIWATMNTSDQSLFPIDSAFKRRWDWQYMPISDGGKQWAIEVGSQKYSWWSFIQKINDEIYDKTKSEDKKLGYYFCKPINGIIKAETFVSKVLFYLWNDVFKDFEEDNGLFVESYDKFYTEGQNGMPLVIKEKVVLFMQKLGVEEIGLSESMVEEEHLLDEDGNSSTLANNRNFDYSKYSVNGEGAYPKGAVAQQAIKQFVLMNPDMSANDVIRTWLSLNVKVPNFIETIQMYNERTAGSSDSVLRTRYKTVEMPNGETLYVSNQYNVERINDLISKVNAQPWGIHIEKVSIGN